ncbi:MAG: hypothetical protein ACFFD9_05600, partial [Candidatus Thorarchaeota archaeon]
MGEKAKVKETVRLYSRVWRLPTYQGIIARILAAVLFGAFISSTVSFFVNPAQGFFWVLGQYLLVLGVPSFLGTILLYAIVRKEGSPLDARRTAGSAQYGMLIWIIFGVIGSLLDLLLMSEFYEIRFWMLGLGAAYMLFAFLVTGLSDHHPLRNFTAALMIPALWYVSTWGLSILEDPVLVFPPLWPFVVLVTFPMFSIAVHFIFRSVSV